MANTQIPLLPAASSAADADLMVIRQGSVDKKVTKAILLDDLNTSIDELKGLLTSTGSGGNYVLTTGGGITVLSVPMAWVWKASHSSVGACTLQIDSATAVGLKTLEGADFTADDVYSGGIYFAVYDGTNFICINAPWAGNATSRGMLELATVAEADTGTDTERAVTPEGLLSSILANAPTAGDATTLIKGLIEIATNAEAQTGTDTTRAITPASLKSVTATTTRVGVVELATNTEAATGTDISRYVTPAHMLTSHDDAITQSLAQVPSASTILAGKVELATNIEVQTGSDTTRAVTPVALASLTSNESRKGLAEIATQTEIDTGTDDERYATPLKLKNWVRDATESVKGFVRRATQVEVDAQTDTEKYVTPAHLSGLSVTGSIIMMGSTVVPAGHLECDGSEISRTTYSNLYSAIGNTWGVGDGATTFNIPDMRGEFPRGWDNGKGVDSGRLVGTSQTDELKSHNHTVSAQLNIGGYTDNGGAPDQRSTQQTLTTSSTGGSETRPRNQCFMYCIRT